MRSRRRLLPRRRSRHASRVSRPPPAVGPCRRKPRARSGWSSRCGAKRTGSGPRRPTILTAKIPWSPSSNNWIGFTRGTPIDVRLYAVDDGCPNGSATIAAEIAGEHPLGERVKVLSLADHLPAADGPLRNLASPDDSRKGGAVMARSHVGDRGRSRGRDLHRCGQFRSLRTTGDSSAPIRGRRGEGGPGQSQASGLRPGEGCGVLGNRPQSRRAR
jgi:hypothetical protein